MNMFFEYEYIEVLTTHLHLVPRLEIPGILSPLSPTSSWRCVQLSTAYVFTAWHLIKHRNNFTLLCLFICENLNDIANVWHRRASENSCSWHPEITEQTCPTDYQVEMTDEDSRLKSAAEGRRPTSTFYKPFKSKFMILVPIHTGRHTYWHKFVFKTVFISRLRNIEHTILWHYIKYLHKSWTARNYKQKLL
jgi:hypothetical protein